jgi:hypothetical protein
MQAAGGGTRQVHSDSFVFWGHIAPLVKYPLALQTMRRPIRLVGGWWLVLICWLIAGGWFVVREKYYWLVADKPNEQGDVQPSSLSPPTPTRGADSRGNKFSGQEPGSDAREWRDLRG